MDNEAHQIGTQVLEAVLLPRAIGAMYFRASNLWFDDPERPSVEEAYLRIENGWTLLRPGEPDGSPLTDLQNDYRDLAAVAARFAGLRVRSVRLGSDDGHLWLTFESGDTLFVNGSNDSYESWELSCGDYMVVALAGGDLAVWSPDPRETAG